MTYLHYPATERGVPALFHNHLFASTARAVMTLTQGRSVPALTYPNNTLLPRPDWAGQLQTTYKDMYFGYLRYSAEAFVLGVVPEDTYKEVTVWNSVLENFPQNSVVGITLPSDDTLAVTEPEVVPYIMRYLGSYVYRVTASFEGDPVIKSDLSLEYDIQEDIVLPITGLRVIVFDYKHNWDKTIEQSYIWNTDILTIKDGTEQRIKLRATPRMQLTYFVLVEDDRAEALNNLLVAWGDKPFVVPLWMDCCSTNGLSASGQTLININETTGTNVNSSTLFYMPFTGEVHAASSVVSNPNPLGSILTDTFTAIDDLNDIREYTLHDAVVMYVSITASINAGTTVTITNDEGIQVAQLNNQVVDDTLEYVIKGSTFTVHVFTNGIANSEDIIVYARDNSEVCTITLANNLLGDIPDGTIIYPCVLAHITSIKEYVSHHDKLKGLVVVFGSEVLPEFPELITHSQYLSSLVEIKPPHWNDGQKQDITSNLFINDYKSGIIGFGRTKEFIGAKIERNDLLLTGNDLRQFKEEAQRRSGRLIPHWLPSFTSDVTVVTSGLLGDAFIIVEDNNNALLFSRSVDYRHLRFLMRDGTLFYKEIVSVIANGNAMQLNLDSVLGIDFTPEDFKQISYMSFVRGESDAVTLLWEHRKLVKIKQVFRGVTQ